MNPTRLNEGRQWPLTLVQDIDAVDCSAQLNLNDPVNPVTGINLTSLVNKMPSGAIITHAFVMVETAWNQGGKLDVGFGAGDASLGNDIDLTVAGKHDLTAGVQNVTGNPVAYGYTAPATPATAGHAKVVITYVVPGRSNEVV